MYFQKDYKIFSSYSYGKKNEIIQLMFLKADNMNICPQPFLNEIYPHPSVIEGPYLENAYQ